MKKILLTTLLILTLIIPQFGCNSQGNNNEPVTKTSFGLDTILAITIYDMDVSEGENFKDAALNLITDAFLLLDKYEKMFSNTIEGSDISNINNSNGKTVEVSDETAELLALALKYCELSKGEFDITVGTVTNLWDFHHTEDGDSNEKPRVPSEDSISKALKHVGYHNVKLDGNKVYVTDPELKIDLGAIAKGYIADKLTEFLEANGVSSAVIDLGGNVVTIGLKSNEKNEPFRVGISNPLGDDPALIGIVPCDSKTVVTSGTYERFFVVDGVKYHHVLDSKTGYPKDTDLLSASIIAYKGNSKDADALSTTCLILGFDKAKELVSSIDGIGAVLVKTDGSIESINAEDFEKF